MKTLRILAAAYIAAHSLTAAAQAALVEIAFSGSTDNASGSVDYAPGGVFAGRLRLDATGIGDASASPTFGDFTLTPALFELNTPLGDILLSDPSFSAPVPFQSVTQRQNPQGVQTFRFGFRPDSADSGVFSGAIDGRSAVSLDLALQTDGAPSQPAFFTDPNLLLSGVDQLVAAMLVNSFVTVSFSAVSGTTLAISEARISFVDSPPVTEIPVPGALPLMLSGLAGLAWLRGRKECKSGAAL